MGTHCKGMRGVSRHQISDRGRCAGVAVQVPGSGFMAEGMTRYGHETRVQDDLVPSSTLYAVFGETIFHGRLDGYQWQAVGSNESPAQR